MPFGNKTLCVWHMPKSGGVWLRRAMMMSGVRLRRIGKPHATVAEYRLGLAHEVDRETGSWEDHTFNATLVRNPMGWYSSTWRWMRKNGTSYPLGQLFPAGIDTEDLEDFGRFLVRHAGSYSKAVKDYSPPRCVYIRTEHMAEDVTAWLKAAGVSFVESEIANCPPQNVTDEEAPEVSVELTQLINHTEGINGRWNN